MKYFLPLIFLLILANFTAQNNTEALEVLTENFQLSDEVELNLIKEFTDNLGTTHQTFRAVINGVPVLGIDYKMHTKAGEVYLMSGKKLPTKISLGAKGLDYAVKYVHRNIISEQLLKENVAEPEFCYIVNGDKLEKAVKVQVYSVSPLFKNDYFVSTTTGKIIVEHNLLKFGDAEGIANTKYSGAQNITTDSINPTLYHLEEYGRGNGIKTMNMVGSYFVNNATHFTDDDNNWNNFNAQQDEVATDVHWATEQYYDYLLNVHNRNSYDNAGGQLVSYVHYGVNFNNAFWDGTAASFGDGNATHNPWASVDLVSHEFTHALIENSAGLLGSYEPGAISEAMADMFAIATEFYAKPATANFIIGEDIISGGLRDLSDPSSDNKPDTYLGTYWATGSADNGGIHTNNMVANYWFYLLINGGIGTNDLGDNYGVIGIGLNKTMKILYRSLDVYLTQNTQYLDFRTFSIQAAEDLYGSCSSEKDAVMNAWHAVGVGAAAPVGNPVIASFSSDVTQLCSLPGVVNFIDQSQNATISYHWDFGDGNTSTLPNPQHTYTSTGAYDVTLVVEGNGSCGIEKDTVIASSYIVVTNTPSPIAVNCTPNSTNSGSFGYGISKVILGTINNSSAINDGYQDYTCAHSTTITEGVNNTIQVFTNNSNQETVRVWIDLNNNGNFEMSELLFENINGINNHNGNLVIPAGAVVNTPLRIRVSSNDNSGFGPCSTLNFGQHEDYTVTVIPNTNPPNVDFTADAFTTNPGQTVNFTDLTTNAPTSWQWYFNGAIPATSNNQNPSVVYPNTGTFPVTLVASNSNGQDSLTKVNYITVQNDYYMCSVDTITVNSGTIFDSGGPFGQYSNNENCGLLIAPPCASSITLNIPFYNTPSSFDKLLIYDGSDATAPLIANGLNGGIPSGASYISSGNTFFLVFESDGVNGYDGFEANFTSTIINSPVTANYSVSSTNPPFNTPVNFTDLSTGIVAGRLWNFGDGTQSVSPNPSHVYTNSGLYNTSVNIFGCVDSSVFNLPITVQAAPEVQVTDTLSITLDCSNDLHDTIWVSNVNGGDLVYSATNINNYTDFNNYNTTAPGENSTFSFNTVCQPDSIELTVSVSGDYNGNNEFVSIIVEGVFINVFNPTTNALSSTTIMLYANNFPNWYTDGSLDVVLDNSGQVNTGVYNEVSVNFNCGPQYIDAVDQTQQLVTLNDSLPIPIYIDANGLEAGNYLDSIQLNTNDTALLSHYLLIDILITGEPDISVNTFLLDFDTITVNSTGIDTLILQNTGCDTLYITNLTNSLSEYSSNATLPLVIPPFSEDSVFVSLNSSNIGTYTDSLLISNNDSNVTVYMNGYVEGVPVMIVSPSIITDTIIGCNDSITIPVWIYNQGLGALEGTISEYNSNLSSAAFYDNFEDGNVTNSVWSDPSTVSQEVVINGGAAEGDDFLRITNGTATHLDGLNASFSDVTPDYIKFYIRNSSVTEYGSFFVVGDNYNTSVTVNTIMYLFMNNNGAFFVNGSFLGSYTANAWYLIELENIDYIAKTFDLYVDGNLLSAAIPFNDASVNKVNGCSVYAWNSNSNADFDEVQIGTMPELDWLEVSLENYATPIADSSLVEITLYSNGLNAGNYNGAVIVTGNDPNNIADTIDVNLTVIGDPFLTSNQVGCDNFGNVSQYQTVSGNIRLYNTGCDTLFINAVTGSVTNLQGSTVDSYILPNDSTTLNYNLFCDVDGPFNETLTVTTNGNTENYCIDGFVMPVPVINTDLDTIFVNLTACNDSVIVPLNIYNTGSADLNFDVSGSISSAVNSDVTNGMILPLDSAELNLTIFSNGNTMGTTYSNFNIISDDPVNNPYSVVISLTISAQPCADAQFNIYSSCTGLVDFTDLSSNNPTSWEWNFDDGTQSTVQNPSHNYTAAGTYNVRLVAFNGALSDTTFLTVNISGTDGPVPSSCDSSVLFLNPDLGLTGFTGFGINNTSVVDNIDGYQDFTCNFLGTANLGGMYNLTFNFPNNAMNRGIQIFLDLNNDGEFTLQEEVYYAPGLVGSTHTGNIIIPSSGVTNTALRMRVFCGLSNIFNTAPCDFFDNGEIEDYAIELIPNTNPPVADFSFSQVDSCTGAIVLLDESYNIPTSWQWDFGDSTTSSTQNPSHTYTQAGTYTVQLTTSNAHGSDVESRDVNIYIAEANFTFVSNVAGQSTQFTSTSVDATAWEWSFGDGNSDNVENPAYIYLDSNCYDVELSIENTKGCKDTIVKEVCTIDATHISEYNIDGLSIGPNPTGGKVFIESSNQLIKEITVLNANGEVIMTHKIMLMNTIIDLSNEADGIYILRITTSNNTGVYRIIKQ